MVNILDYFKPAPNFDVWHSHPDQDSEILITAGMHGDELSSIEAAKLLIKTYRGIIPITVVPIINLGGYKAGVSYNPLDQKDPIYLYPGSRWGSSTSKLLFQIAKISQGKKLWIDLHGGAKEEYLKPFIWAADSYPVLSHLSGRVLVDPSFRRNLPYLILEAGDLGRLNPESVNLHLSWIKQILKNFDKPMKSNWHPTYTGLSYDKNIGQNLKADNFLWSSPTHYMSGKISKLEGGQDGNALVSKTNVRKD
jgi:hypothetical protein